MISRSTWIFLAVFILALGALWYIEWSPAKEARATPSPTSQPTLFNNINTNSVARLEIVSSQGENLIIQKNPDKTWAFLNLTGKLVDQGQAEYLTSSLFSMNIKSTLPDEINLNSIGLDAATTTIKITSNNGSMDLLHIGKINPVKNGYYVRLNAQKPVLVDNNALNEVMNLFSQTSLMMATPTPFPTKEISATLNPQPTTNTAATKTP